MYSPAEIDAWPTSGHQIPLAARLDPDDRETGIRVVERHAFDAADQRFAIGATLIVTLAANGTLLGTLAQPRVVPGAEKIPDCISTPWHASRMVGLIQVTLQG